MAAVLISIFILPWTVGIVRNVQHIHLDRVPENLRGIYLLADQGAMQLFDWNLQTFELLDDAPTLAANEIHGLAVVQKQFSPPESYMLFRLGSGSLIPWQKIEQQQHKLVLDPGVLPAGDYMFILPLDSIFGGQTYHYFSLD